MAIVWGAFEYAGGNGMRVGIDVTWSTPTNTSASVSASYDVWTENQFGYSDAQTLTYGGSESPVGLTNVTAGTLNYTNAQATGTSTQRISNLSYTHTYGTASTALYGTSPGTITLTASVSGTYNGVTPSVSVATAIPARPIAAPASPVLTATTSSSSAIALSWTAPDDNGGAITNYTLQASSTSATAGFATIDTGTTRTFSYTGLTKYNQYWFRVSATNSAGTSAYSTPADTATTSATVPGVPTAFTATPSVSSVALDWVVPADTGGIGLNLATDYIVKRDGVALAYTGSTTAFTDTGVTPATAYVYTVAAVNSIGTGTAATVSTTTIGGVVNIATAVPGTYVKVLPKVCTNATAGSQVWTDAQARIWNNTSEWKYGI
jgi:hypothetical protein